MLKMPNIKTPTTKKQQLPPLFTHSRLKIQQQQQNNKKNKEKSLINKFFIYNFICRIETKSVFPPISTQTIFKLKQTTTKLHRYLLKAITIKKIELLRLTKNIAVKKNVLLLKIIMNSFIENKTEIYDWKKATTFVNEHLKKSEIESRDFVCSLFVNSLLLIFQKQKMVWTFSLSLDVCLPVFYFYWKHNLALIFKTLYELLK